MKKMLPVMLVVLSFLIGLSMTDVFLNIAFDVSFFIKLSILLVSIFIFYFLEIIIHESGHLFFGLITGYKLLYFRIGGLLFYKKDEKLKISFKKIAGTAGQCIMVPSLANKGRYFLYNYGGPLFDLFVCIISLILIIFMKVSIYKILPYSSLLIGLFMFVINGFPFDNDLIGNDAYNIKMIRKDDFAKECFFRQLRIIELQTNGTRLKDMPDDLFIMPDSYDKTNTMITTIDVFNENRALDKGEFEKCLLIIDDLLSNNYKLIGIYRFLLLNDKMLLQILLNMPFERSILLDKNMINFRKSMKSNSSILICDYAIERKVNNNQQKAKKIKERLIYILDNSNDLGEVKSCLALIELIDKL